MSTPHPPKPAKLVVSVLINNRKSIDTVGRELTRVFGDMDLISPWFSFHYTDYYRKEMGSGLTRRVFSFQSLVHQSDLAHIKISTNAMEKLFSQDGKRTVNIDPGYILQERFVLGTGKNFAHRIYIGGGIYSDLTLIYTKGAFTKLPWTYPDYVAEEMLSFLLMVRARYSVDLGRLGQR